MTPQGFFRSSMRRPLLALIIAGGVMTMAPVHAALPTAGLLGGSDQSSTPLPLDLGSTLDGAVDPTADLVSDALGGDPLGSALGGELLGGDLLGDALGGDLLGGDVLGGVLGDSDDASEPEAHSASSEPSGNGVHVGGVHVGVKGQNPLETVLGIGCEDTSGIIRTGLPGVSLTLPVAVGGILCPDGAPADPPGNPPVTNPTPDPDPEVLPAGDEQNPRPLVAPPTLLPAVVNTAAPAAPAPAPATAPAPRTTLPRTGPGGLFQGPVALGLLGVSTALRMVLRRHPEVG